MRYLAYTERTLKLGGPEALAHMPVEVMRKTLEQLQELVTDWSSAGLAELRMQLEVLIAEKEEVSNQTFGSTDTPSDFDTPRKLHVEEATVSQFQAAERGWQSPNRPPSWPGVTPAHDEVLPRAAPLDAPPPRMMCVQG